MSENTPPCSFDVSQRQASSGSELLKAVPQTANNLNIIIKHMMETVDLGSTLGVEADPGLKQVEAVSQDLLEIMWVFCLSSGLLTMSRALCTGQGNLSPGLRYGLKPVFKDLS